VKAVLISDIHITGPHDPLYRSLIEMVRAEIGPGDALVLAGDIFDFFVGKQPTLLRRYRELFDLIREKARAGARIDYIEGNHDFHLRRAFEELFEGLPVTVHPEEVVIATPSGRRLYVAHGDLVDREDRGYLALRALFRSPLAWLASVALPESVVDAIGAKSAETFGAARSGDSRGAERIAALREKFRAFARAKFDEGFDSVVLGHCHDLDGCELESGQRRGRYLNIGFPRAHRSYVVFSEESGLTRRPLPGLDSGSPRE
jgi:UDP-2,3-diacylglucosamine hydrolase